jgi:hypothetical protein
MIIDKNCMLLDNAAYTASPEEIDLGQFPGTKPLLLHVICTAGDAASAGSPSIDVQTGTTGSLTSDAIFGPFTPAEFNAGITIPIVRRPPTGRIMSIALDSGDALTAGTGIDAFITLADQSNL